MNIPDSVWTSIVVALIVKVLWDYWKSGRAEKGVYLTITDFDKHRKDCCAIQLKKDIAADKNDTIAARTHCHSWMITMDEGVKLRTISYENRFQQNEKRIEKLIDTWLLIFE
jgi:hypothetical protein